MGLFNLPASENVTAAVTASEAMADWLASTAQETVHLINEHLQRAVSVLYAISSWERMSCGQDTVGVDTRLAVQTVPDDRRQVEQNRLDFARQIYTSVIQAKFIS